jgi:hypothetical protein
MMDGVQPLMSLSVLLLSMNIQDNAKGTDRVLLLRDRAEGE